MRARCYARCARCVCFPHSLSMPQDASLPTGDTGVTARNKGTVERMSLIEGRSESSTLKPLATDRLRRTSAPNGRDSVRRLLTSWNLSRPPPPWGGVLGPKKFVYQKRPNKSFPTVNFVVPTPPLGGGEGSLPPSLARSFALFPHADVRDQRLPCSGLRDLTELDVQCGEVHVGREHPCHRQAAHLHT